MRTQTQDTLLCILRSICCTQENIPAFAPDAVLELARQHKLAHLVQYALSGQGHPGSLHAVSAQMYATEQQLYLLEQIRHLFGENHIPFIPLKGSVLRNLYPEAWMRSCCDTDILIQKENLEKAVQILTQAGYVPFGSRTLHDVHFRYDGQILELHFTLLKELEYKKTEKILDQVWKYATPVTDWEYTLPDSMFYFYHIAHMVKHFKNGGCGIRPFLDLWFLNHRVSFDREARYTLLQAGGMDTFARAAEELAENWFSGANTDTWEELEQYIFSGNAYGTLQNRIAIQKGAHGGKNAFLLSRLFMPYAKFQEICPILKKYPVLYPFFALRRGLHGLFRPHTYRELREIAKKTPDRTMRAMLKKLGLL